MQARPAVGSRRGSAPARPRRRRPVGSPVSAPVVLGRLVEDVVGRYATARVPVRCSLPPGLGSTAVPASYDDLYRALTNLVDNAVRRLVGCGRLGRGDRRLHTGVCVRRRQRHTGGGPRPGLRPLHPTRRGAGPRHWRYRTGSSHRARVVAAQWRSRPSRGRRTWRAGRRDAAGLQAVVSSLATSSAICAVLRAALAEVVATDEEVDGVGEVQGLTRRPTNVGSAPTTSAGSGTRPRRGRRGPRRWGPPQGPAERHRR